MNGAYKDISVGHRHHTYIADGDGDQVLHIVKLGHEDTYAVFYDDAYETEPWQTGLQVMRRQEIFEKFGITI